MDYLAVYIYMYAFVFIYVYTRLKKPKVSKVARFFRCITCY